MYAKTPLTSNHLPTPLCRMMGAMGSMGGAYDDYDDEQGVLPSDLPPGMLEMMHQMGLNPKDMMDEVNLPKPPKKTGKKNGKKARNDL